MLNSMVVFTFFLTGNTLFRQIWSKKAQRSFSAGIQKQELFKYEKFSGVVNFFSFSGETLFLGKFGPKHQHCQPQLKFTTKPNWNIPNARVVFTFSVLHRKHSFWANFVRKRIIVSLSRNLAPRLISIYRTQWHCSVFLFQTGKSILGKFGEKSQNWQFQLMFGTKTNSNMPNSMMVFTFSVSDGKAFFSANLVQNSKMLV